MSGSVDTRDNDSRLVDHARTVAQRLIAHRLTLATAESCTGGWIAKILTDLAGSSEWFAGGVVSYSNDVKQRLLGVRAQTLIAHGAVSAECAHEMVTGVLERLDTDLAVAVTGIAGPTGGTADKPVGTVWIAWQRRDRAARVELFRFDGDRAAVRRQTVATALAELLPLLD